MPCPAAIYFIRCCNSTHYLLITGTRQMIPFAIIVGWRVSSTMETSFVLDALEQALWARRPSGGDPQAKLENAAGCGAGHAEMGGLVQPSPFNGTHRIYPASGGRKSVLRFTEQPGCGSLNTQAKYSPGLPGRFIVRITNMECRSRSAPDNPSPR